MAQHKIEQTGSNPIQARVTSRGRAGEEEHSLEITDVARATEMVETLQNAEGGSQLGVWRGTGISE